MGRAHSSVTPVDRFWASVFEDDSDEDACLIWTGSCNSNGYGELSVDGKKVKVHRFSYELHIGPIPEGMAVRHTCQVKLCVNHEHFWTEVNPRCKRKAA